MLRIENLEVRFGQTCLFGGMNLNAKRGEVVCLTGPSGCGKTTLLKAVMGFVCPCQGDIRVEDILLTPQTAHAIRQRIAWMPQGLSLPCEWVREMVNLPLDLKVNRGGEPTEERLKAHFKALGLEWGLMEKRLHEVSGGQRQRILLATTAIQEKPLMMLDEPTSALDKGSGMMALEFIRRMAHEEGRTVIAVSHDPDFMAGCDKLVNL